MNWGKIATALLTLGLLPACNKGVEKSAAESNKVRIGYIGLTCEAPIFSAVEKGFFKDEGLDVDLRPVQGIPDSQHPRHQWRKEGAIIFQSPGGSPPFRSVLENRDHIDGEVNVVSIAN